VVILLVLKPDGLNDELGTGNNSHAQVESVTVGKAVKHLDRTVSVHFDLDNAGLPGVEPVGQGGHAVPVILGRSECVLCVVKGVRADRRTEGGGQADGNVVKAGRLRHRTIVPPFRGLYKTLVKSHFEKEESDPLGEA
jgi:hypothetical protein